MLNERWLNFAIAVQHGVALGGACVPKLFADIRIN
jgi:enoyl-CoA hydratase/carnithine racemase